MFFSYLGLANQFLVSGQLFNGYIPEAGGGVCSATGNVLIISHGSENTPAPMALFLAALVRGVTRALGANDRDPKCDEGPYPNPMRLLEGHLMTSKEVEPSEQHALFTTCNVKEIDHALSTRGKHSTSPPPLFPEFLSLNTENHRNWNIKKYDSHIREL